MFLHEYLYIFIILEVIKNTFWVTKRLKYVGDRKYIMNLLFSKFRAHFKIHKKRQFILTV